MSIDVELKNIDYKNNKTSTHNNDGGDGVGKYRDKHDGYLIIISMSFFLYFKKSFRGVMKRMLVFPTFITD